MTKRDLFSVALKVLGVYFLIRIIQTVVYYLESVSLAPTKAAAGVYTHGHFFILILVSALVLAVVDIALIAASDRIAKRLISDDSPMPAIDFRRDAKSMFILTAKVIGVLLIISAVTAVVECLLKNFFRIYYIGNISIKDVLMNVYLTELRAGRMSLIISSILKIAFGLYLAIGTTGLANLLYRDRTPVEEESASLPE